MHQKVPEVSVSVQFSSMLAISEKLVYVWLLYVHTVCCIVILLCYTILYCTVVYYTIHYTLYYIVLNYTISYFIYTLIVYYLEYNMD